MKANDNNDAKSGSGTSVVATKDCVPGSGCDPGKSKVASKFDDLTVVCELVELDSVPFFAPEPAPPVPPVLPPFVDAPMSGMCVDVKPKLTITHGSGNASTMEWATPKAQSGSGKEDCTAGVYELNLALDLPCVSFTDVSTGSNKGVLTITPEAEPSRVGSPDDGSWSNKATASEITGNGCGSKFTYSLNIPTPNDTMYLATIIGGSSDTGYTASLMNASGEVTSTSNFFFPSVNTNCSIPSGTMVVGMAIRSASISAQVDYDDNV